MHRISSCSSDSIKRPRRAKTTVIMREMVPIGEMAPGCGKRRKKYLIIFSHPHRRDGTGCDLNDVNRRVSATAPGAHSDIRAPLLSRIITAGTCVVSTAFMRGNESSCFHLIGMKIVRSQPSPQHTYGTCRLQPPRSQKELVWYYGTWCRRGRTRTTLGS